MSSPLDHKHRYGRRTWFVTQRSQLNLKISNTTHGDEILTLDPCTKLQQWVDLLPFIVDSGNGPYRALLLSLKTTQAQYLVEVYVRYHLQDKDPYSVEILSTELTGFCITYIASRKPLEEWSQQRDRNASGTTLPCGRFSLSRIEGDLLARLRSRLGKNELKELHLFLIDPKDRMLYFATTDQLRLSPPLTPDQVLRIPPLTRTRDPRFKRLNDLGIVDQTNRAAFKKESHVKQRLARLEREKYGGDSRLQDIYDQLMSEQGLAARQVTENELKDLLLCLPQELEEGITGDAVCSRVLTVGGPPSGRGEYCFFAQKLAIEKLFGVGRSGYLTATPVYEAGQVVGSLFVVTATPPTRSERTALLDTALDASHLLTQYRISAFQTDVINTLYDNPDRQFLEVIEEHLGQLISHSFLAVLHKDAAGHVEVSHAWCWPQRELTQQRVTHPAVTKKHPLLPILQDIVTKSDGVAPIPLDDWTKGYFAEYLQGKPRTALFLPYDDENGFLLLLPEDEESVRLSRDKWEQKLATLDVLAKLPNVFKHSHEAKKHREWWSFSSHNLPKRFTRTLQVIQKRLERLALNTSMAESPRVDFKNLADELLLSVRMMDSQFHLLRNTDLAGHETVTYVPVDVGYILRTYVIPFFYVMIQARDGEVADNVAYSKHVKVVASRIGNELLVPIRAGQVTQSRSTISKNRERLDPTRQSELCHDLAAAFLSICENTIKDYSISPTIIFEEPERCIVEISASRINNIIEIVITDNGEGMSQEWVTRYNEHFARFARGDAPPYRDRDRSNVPNKGDGSQIGLCHAPFVFATVVDQKTKLRGRMSVSRHSPHGTSVSIYLPAWTTSENKIG